MSEDEGVGRGSEGDCAVWVIFNQDADGHCRRRTAAGFDRPDPLNMSNSSVVLLFKLPWCFP